MNPQLIIKQMLNQSGTGSTNQSEQYALLKRPDVEKNSIEMANNIADWIKTNVLNLDSVENTNLPQVFAAEWMDFYTTLENEIRHDFIQNFNQIIETAIEHSNDARGDVQTGGTTDANMDYKMDQLVALKGAKFAEKYSVKYTITSEFKLQTDMMGGLLTHFLNKFVETRPILMKFVKDEMKNVYAKMDMIVDRLQTDQAPLLKDLAYKLTGGSGIATSAIQTLTSGQLNPSVSDIPIVSAIPLVSNINDKMKNDANLPIATAINNATNSSIPQQAQPLPQAQPSTTDPYKNIPSTMPVSYDTQLINGKVESILTEYIAKLITQKKGQMIENYARILQYFIAKFLTEETPDQILAKNMIQPHYIRITNQRCNAIDKRSALRILLNTLFGTNRQNVYASEFRKQIGELVRKYELNRKGLKTEVLRILPSEPMQQFFSQLKRGVDEHIRKIEYDSAYKDVKLGTDTEIYHHERPEFKMPNTPISDNLKYTVDSDVAHKWWLNNYKLDIIVNRLPSFNEKGRYTISVEFANALNTIYKDLVLQTDAMYKIFRGFDYSLRRSIHSISHCFIDDVKLPIFEHIVVQYMFSQNSYTTELISKCVETAVELTEHTHCLMRPNLNIDDDTKYAAVVEYIMFLLYTLLTATPETVASLSKNKNLFDKYKQIYLEKMGMNGIPNKSAFDVIQLSEFGECAKDYKNFKELIDAIGSSAAPITRGGQGNKYTKRVHFTPFRIQNAKSVAHSSVISGHEVGELNEKRRKMPNTHKFTRRTFIRKR